MKLHRYEIERYPDYALDEPSEIFSEANVDAPGGLYARYRRALAEYNAVQFEIANLPELDIEPKQTRSDMLKELLPKLNDMFNAEYEAMEKRVNNDWYIQRHDDRTSLRGYLFNINELV